MQRNTSCGTFLDGVDDVVEEGVDADDLDSNDIGKLFCECNGTDGGRIESLEPLSIADDKCGTTSDRCEVCESIIKVLDLESDAAARC